MRWRDVAIILAWFALTRLLALSAGVEPEPGLHEFFWQLLPFDLLDERLAESLWYLHSQPPLYNAFVGVLLDLPGDYAIWWRLAWIAVGALFPLLVCASLIHAGAPRLGAHTVTLVVSLNPTYLLYENLLLYTYPEALCVLAGFWALLRTGLGRPAWVAFASATTALVLFRAMFQPVWSLGVAFAALTGLDRPRRAAYVALSVPLLIGTLLIAKNAAMFGVWASSSWYGHNLAKVMAMAMLGETPALAAGGVVSPVFVAGPFVPVRNYPPEWLDRAIRRAQAEHGDVPALTVESKANGSPNFNHIVYIDLSRQLAEDSRAAYRARPWLAREAVLKGLQQFHQPASMYAFLDRNWRRVRPLENVYLSLTHPGNTLLIVEAAVIVTILSSAWVWLFGTGVLLPLRAAAGYVLVTMVWVAVTGNLAEFGENARFRFTTDPMMITWLGVVATRVLLIFRE